MSNDVFYKMKHASPEKVREALRWANDNRLRTIVTMLDVHKSYGRVSSDKGFDTVLSLIDERAGKFFGVVLRKEMNLFGVLTDERVVKDILEMFIRGIEADSKEYFISILLDKTFINELKERYGLKCLSGAEGET